MGAKKVLVAICFVLSVCAFAFAEDIIVAPIAGLSENFIRGVDVSMLEQVEAGGGKFFDANGEQKDLFVILKDAGVNWIRLRLWHSPELKEDIVYGGNVIAKKGETAGGANDLPRTIRMAKRASDAGFKILLDIHYSDTWADPAKQFKPAAWKDLKGAALENAVYEYTVDVLKQLKVAGVTPEMVQTGNELNGGMLWPDGKTWKGDADDEIGGMKGFGKLLKSAGKAVRELCPNAKIAIHLADGGDNGLYRFVFDGLKKEKVDYDCIGLSYYNYWHGSLDALKNNMADLAKRYEKEMYIAETAYGYTEDDFDAQGNVFMVYSDDNIGYQATVQGQATVVRDIMNTVASFGNLGLGVFYWEPAWLPVEGAGWQAGAGNNWDNQTMFDKNGKALASLDVFKKVYDKTPVEIVPVNFEPVALTIAPNETKKSLPERVKVIYSDDSIRAEKINWAAHDFSKETELRTFPVTGTVANGSFTVKADVTVSDIVNLVEDTSWESGKLGEWKYSGPDGACFLENNKSNAYTGAWTYKYWLSGGFKSMLSRTFKNIPNGSYTLKIWAMGGGGENDIKLYARNYGNNKTTSIKIENTGWKEWKQYVIPNVQVTNGQCTIGIYLDTNADCWGNFDDVEFYQNKK